ncbi:DUF4595 domain-containing protein [Pararcticibacter amylolyticus]|uniref:Uncharacterized protein n=1 Tax=Pararcticibacter amylolyticus TaxID=2173175 RepID=A0A2U2PBJ8_9SPHI|nr:DUF4595 domain-containing protein [Pararcticibacter amylolyticus]PWG78733.1 hypothetical protein DDR33_21165 [Pararcticibacter amylolyticus]
MIRKFTFLALMAAALFNACSKEDAPPGNEKQCIITSLYKTDAQGKRYATANLMYDAQGRLTKLTSDNDTAFFDFKANYEDAKKTVTVYDESEYLRSVINLDDKGRAQKLSLYNGTYAFLFSYQDDYLSTLTWQYNNKSIYSYALLYSNGNLVSVKAQQNTGNIDIRFEYDDQPAVSIPNVGNPLSHLGIPLVLPGILGKTSKNRLVKVVEPFNDGLTRTRTTTYQYETDKDGKITAVKYLVSVAFNGQARDYQYGHTLHIEYKCEE